MKLIIDIDENVYKAMKTTYLNSYPQFDGYDMCVMSKKVREGTPLQTELEKIKAEISDYAVVDDSKSIKRGFEIMQGIVLELLDEHISELKGE